MDRGGEEEWNDPGSGGGHSLTGKWDTGLRKC